MPTQEDIDKTSNAIKKALFKGNRCIGYAAKKDKKSLMELIEASCRDLGLEFIQIDKDSTYRTPEAYIKFLQMAFKENHSSGVLIAVDASPCYRPEWRAAASYIKEAIEDLRQKHPNTIYVNVIGYNANFSEEFSISSEEHDQKKQKLIDSFKQYSGQPVIVYGTDTKSTYLNATLKAIYALASNNNLEVQIHIPEEKETAQTIAECLHIDLEKDDKGIYRIANTFRIG